MIKEDNTRSALEVILKTVVMKPTLETEERNKDAVDKPVWIHNLRIDTVTIPKREDLSDLTYLWMIALQKELTWAIISTISCSYVSSLMTIRGIFEMLVKMLTHEGSVGKRIDKIEFLEKPEKKELKKLWDDLSGWIHPYERWIREIDGEISMLFRYDKTMCEKCVDYLLIVCDLMMVIALEKGFCEPEEVSRDIETLGLEMSMRRLKGRYEE